MKEVPTLATVLLEIYWSTNSPESRNHSLAMHYLFLASDPVRSSYKPRVSFPNTNAVPARGWRVGCTAKQPEALGLGDHVGGY